MSTRTTTPVNEALDRVAAFFRDRDTRPGILARRLFGNERKGDAQLLEHLVRERRRRTRIDGSMDGSLIKTAWTAWELLDLDCPTDHAAVVRTIGYVLAQQDRPGHYAEGCTPERHERRICHHFVRGFFSPGGADEPIAPVTFPSGAVVESEDDARIAASCFALRAVLRAGEDRRERVRQHLDSLVTLMVGPGLVAPADSLNLRFFTVGALAMAPPGYRDHLEAVTQLLAAAQREDGSWPQVSLFHALDMLLSATTAQARDMVRRIAPLLCSMQQPGGAFDADETEEWALVAARALRIAVQRDDRQPENGR